MRRRRRRRRRRRQISADGEIALRYRWDSLPRDSKEPAEPAAAAAGADPVAAPAATGAPGPATGAPGPATAVAAAPSGGGGERVLILRGCV